MKILFVLLFIFNGISLLIANDTVPQSLSNTDKIVWLNDKARENLEINPDLSHTYATQARNLAININDVKGLSNALNYLGLSCFNQTHYSEAINYFQQAVKILINRGDNNEAANLFQKIGMCYLQEKNYRNAIFYYQQTLKLFEQLQYEDKIAHTYYELGIIYYLIKDYNRSAELLLSSIEKYNQLGNLIEKTRSIYQLGVTYDAMNNYKNALTCFQGVLNIHESLNNREQIVIVLNYIGNIHIKLKQYDEATITLNKALNLSGLEQIDLRGQIYLNLGNIAYNKRDYKEAERLYEKSLNIATNTNNQQLLKNTYKKFHELYSASNNTRKALDYFYLYNQAINNVITESELEIKEDESNYSIEDLYITLLAISLTVNAGLIIVIFIIVRQRNKIKETLYKHLYKKNKLLLK